MVIRQEKDLSLRSRLFLFLWIGSAMAAPIQGRASGGFDVVVLGARGGIEDGNLSSYLIRPDSDKRYIACDAGTLVNGIRVAEQKGVFNEVHVPSDSPDSRTGYILKEEVGAYLISHAHLDHVAGLAIASPDDSAKPIYALPSVIDALKRDYFNWETWPNFGDEGKEPTLKKYSYHRLQAGVESPVSGTAMKVTAFPLSHDRIESTAFLLESDQDSMLYFGDTGPDTVEHSTRMHDVWVAVADKVRRHQMRAILIESSYDNSQPDSQLYGHLSPKWLLKALHDLENQAGGKGSLTGLPIMVGHIKYSLKKGPQPQREVLRELEQGNDLGVKFILSEQGMHQLFRRSSDQR